ncbi:hypothetical protein HispidOSU_021559, partial [Sigmodon hispidus]
EDEFHCTSVKSIANTVLVGLNLLRLREHSALDELLCLLNLILAQEEEQYLQNEDPQLAEHVLLCLLLITSLSANVSTW